MGKMTIPNNLVTDALGRPYRWPKADPDTGEVEWVVKPSVNEKGERVPGDPSMEQATVEGILTRVLILQVPPSILTKQDSINATRMASQIIESRGNGHIMLHENEYKWLHKLLDRPLPASAEEAKRKDAERVVTTFGIDRFGVHLHAIQQQLRARNQDGSPDTSDGVEWPTPEPE